LTDATVVAGRSDAEIIECSTTCPEEFARIFDRHARVLHGYLRRRAGRPEADDLLAETFLVAFKSRDRYDPAVTDARPWLFGIATNLLRRTARSEARAYRALARTGLDRVAAFDDQVAERVDAGATVRLLAGALGRLPRRDRDALLMYAWAELSYDEIARALEIPVGTVRSRLHRARRQLRAALERRGTTTEE
jgi:RNA polymerase sigma-70 factor (ECF subfamily)